MSFTPAHVPSVVAFLPVYSHLQEMLRVTFHKPKKPGRLKVFDRRASLSHLWRGIAGSQLKTLEMDFCLPNPNMNLDVDDMGPLPGFKQLYVLIKHAPFSDEQLQEDEESLVAAAASNFVDRTLHRQEGELQHP